MCDGAAEEHTGEKGESGEQSDAERWHRRWLEKLEECQCQCQWRMLTGAKRVDEDEDEGRLGRVKPRREKRRRAGEEKKGQWQVPTAGNDRLRGDFLRIGAVGGSGLLAG